MFLIDDILFFPVSGIKFVMNTLRRASEEQWTDDAPIKEALLELQLRLESEEITEEAYVQEEGVLLKELREIGERRKKLAGVTEEEHGEEQ